MSKKTAHFKTLVDQRLRLQQALFALSQKALTNIPLYELFDNAGEQLTNILDIDLTSIVEFFPAKQTALLRSIVGWDEHIETHQDMFPLENNLMAYTLSTKKPVIIEDFRTETRFKKPEKLLAHHLISGMTIMLYRNKAPYGALCVFSKKKRTFTTDDINYLQSIGNVLSLAIQQEEVEKQMQKNEERFRHLTQVVPQIIWIANHEGKIEYVNKQWEEYTKTPASKALGDGWTKTLHPRDRNRVWMIWNNCVKTGKPFDVECLMKTGLDSQYTWFLCRAVPARDEHGAITQWFGTYTNIDNQKHTQWEFERSTALTDAILQSLPSQVVVLDQKGKILAVNDTLKSFTFENTQLYPSEVSIGNNYLRVLSLTKKKYGVYYEQIKHGVQAVLDRKVSDFSLEYSYKRHKDQAWFLLQVALLKHDETGVVVSHTDITERKKLEKQKDEFMSIASHELKTPLTSLKAYGQVLMSDFKRKNDQQSVKLLEKMDVQLNKITDLISDFLDVSRIEAGKLQVDEEWFDLDVLIQEVLESMQLTTDKHTILFAAHTTSTVHTNRDRLGQVLINFVSNAIKYSPENTTITITSFTDDHGVAVCVADQGIGISKEKQTKVFERFYRVSEDNRHTKPGLGLGLYISAEIIKLIGGKIWVESNEGRGSRFCFSLPENRVQYRDL